MKVKSINLISLNWCNSKCLGCKIYTNTDNHKFISNEMLLELFQHDEFKEVEDIGFSGGEPMLHPDLERVIETIVLKNKSLITFFFNTNATAGKERIIKIVRNFASKVPQFHLLVSVDGNRETYKYTRGIDNFNRCVELLKSLSELKSEIPNLRVGISATLFKKTATVENLNYLVNLSAELNVDFTFRFADVGEMFYNNISNKDEIVVEDSQKLNLMTHSKVLGIESDFIKWQKEEIETGINPVMKNKANELVCRAGELFVFLDANGDIYPCHLSNRKIGNYQTGITKKNLLLGGIHEPCPCLTECTAYPQEIFGKKYPKNEN
jgi:MoaA/NifB/PqqE/SkfB family radical SAM enzyme